MVSGLDLNTNVSALNTLDALQQNQSVLSNLTEELTTGYRVNSPQNDPAAFAIAQEMTYNISGDQQAITNTENASSMVQTAEGGVQQQLAMLQQEYSLAVEAANGTNTSSDLTNIQDEINQLNNEINHIADTTSYNSINLLAAATSVTFQVGADNSASNQVAISFQATTTTALNIATVNVTTQTGAEQAIASFQAAISTLTSFDAQLGSYIDRFQYTANELQNASTNLQAARGNVEDVNMAQAMTQYSQTQVLVQAGASMLSQAQAQPDLLLTLLSKLP